MLSPNMYVFTIFIYSQIMSFKQKILTAQTKLQIINTLKLINVFKCIWPLTYLTMMFFLYSINKKIIYINHC